MQVTIKVRTVGQAFGCVGDIFDPRGLKLSETRLYPYGQRHNAYVGAERIASDRGWVVV